MGEHGKGTGRSAEGKTVAGYKAKLVAQGYDEALADATAAAMESGDMATVFANNQTFLEKYAQKVIAGKLKRTPRGADGNPGGAMTKADFLKLDTKSQMEFIKNNPDWKTILK